jgi:hypothetical protein
MQRLDVRLVVGLDGAGFAVKHVRGTLQQLPLPFGHLVRMNLVVLGDLGQCLSPRNAAKAPFALKLPEWFCLVLLVMLLLLYSAFRPRL